MSMLGKVVSLLTRRMESFRGAWDSPLTTGRRFRTTFEGVEYTGRLRLSQQQDDTILIDIDQEITKPIWDGLRVQIARAAGNGTLQFLPEVP